MKKFGSTVEFIGKAVALLILLIVQYYYHGFDRLPGIPLKYIEAFILYLSANVIISASRFILVFLYIRRKGLPSGIRDNFIIGIGQIAALLSWVFLLLAILYLFNLDFKSLFTSLSIVAAAIALLSKDYISNMINGMILMFSGQLKINDNIKVGSQTGRIADITLINIRLVNEDGDGIIIPNNSLFIYEVLNFTREEEEKIIVEFEMDLKHSAKIDEMKNAFDASLGDWKNQIVPGSSEFKILEIKPGSLIAGFQLMVRLPAADAVPRLRQEIKRSITMYLARQI